MTRIATLLGVAALCLAVGGAQAGVNKTWVSSTGTDSGVCSLAAPCATFQYAHDQTNSGGEIDVKDSGGYGILTITKSISVIAGDGVLATINVPSGQAGVGVYGANGKIVLLKGLVINGHNQNAVGISPDENDHITIDNCVIVGNSTGINVIGGSSNLYITGNLLHGNGTGIVSITNAVVVIGNNRITGNGTGVKGVNMFSYGDNKINGNITTDVDPGTTLKTGGSMMQ